MIEIRALLIQRNGRDVLKIDSLEIARGETLTVVGPNGAGKSTLLLALAMLIKPTAGNILYKDGYGSVKYAFSTDHRFRVALPLLSDLEYRRKIAFVFQAPLLMDMTVEQNVALGLKFRGVSKEETRERVNTWIKALGVESLAKRRAGQLSGGEAQRVSLARAFVLDPELLLLDEPFAALDPPTHARLLEDLSDILEQDHRTAVFVTHNLREAAQVGDRIAVLVGGELKQVGTARQIKSHPADEAVRAFLHELPQ